MGWLPDWFMYYPVLEFSYFILYYIVRYRLKVVRDNLKQCYPDKTQRELRWIERGYYRQLAEVFIDMVRMFGIGKERFKQRVRYVNAEEVAQVADNFNTIFLYGHYGFWEYEGTYQFYTGSQVVGVYHPLTNKTLDALIYYSRSRFGALPVTMRNLIRYIVDHKDDKRKFALGLIADQNTPYRDAKWFTFLGRRTVFFNGAERIAMKFSMPIFYIDVQKLGRARYQMEFKMLYDGKESVSDDQITERYVRELEKTINRDPRYWMWSHKRWKRIEPKND